MKLQNAINTIIVSIMVMSCAQAAELVQSNTIETRAAFDIGSGETKITIANVDTKTNKITEIFFQKAQAVELREDLGKSQEKLLSKAIEQELINAITGMQNIAAEYKVKKYAAIGTSVFRNAINGQDVLARVEKATQVKINLLDQAEEGEVGFNGAVAALKKDPKKVISWDSGSGSFQLTSLVKSTLKTYGAEFAIKSTIESLFALRKNTNPSPNPISQEESDKLIETITTLLPKVPSWIKNKKKQLIGFGGNCIFSRAELVIGKATYTRDEVRETISKFYGKNDEQLETLFPNVNHRETVVGLILLYTVMDHCGFKKVTYAKTNGGCEGLLVTPKFWK